MITKIISGRIYQLMRNKNHSNKKTYNNSVKYQDVSKASNTVLNTKAFSTKVLPPNQAHNNRE